ncbi:hypothetical protein AVEN_158602-1 [Araneus ventricosus]|uniref:Uncharacterized protein n=1 Tax=Araneus ventricosus TaxID=182803 RepID=A0A4Y2JN18_ARAVE|nr:hypothetical protein AVEN_158602-1 [Araneus ventricosus]
MDPSPATSAGSTFIIPIFAPVEKLLYVLWVTSRSRVPVDGAAIASDVRVSSCREQIVGHQPQPNTCRWRCHRQRRQSIKLPRTAEDDDA